MIKKVYGVGNKQLQAGKEDKFIFFAVHRKFYAVHDMFQAFGRFLLLQSDDTGLSL